MKRTINLRGALRRSAGAAAVLLAISGSAGAVSLQQAYQAALKNDPTFRMNFYEKEYGKENEVLGRANILPTVSASFSASRNIADQTGPGMFGIGTSTTHPRYIGRSSVVQMRQPLLNMEGIARYRQGKVQTQLSDAQFQVNTNEVALRAVTAYLDVLFAEDQLALARVQRDMYAEQQKVNQRMFEKGEGTRTDMLETQARLDVAEAMLLESQDNVAAVRNTLAGVIGMDPGTLDKLGADFRVGDRRVAPFEEWRVLAIENNRELAAARLAVENARLDISRNKAGHLPRVDLVASYAKSDAETLNTYNSNSVNRTIGVQVNIPIYAGGAVNATTRQAAANYERAKADLEARTNKVIVDLRKAHSQVESSAHKVDALMKAVESAKLLMTATEQSIKGGVRINLDLLNAQQQLFTAQRDLAQARYGYLIALLRLRASANVIGDADIREIGAYFH